MAWSVRRKRFAARLVGLGVNPVRVRVRTALGREQHYAIDGVPVVLPPEHNLPFYQRRDPTYDAYATELVRALAPRSVAVLDLGANVGDTAAGMLAAGEHVVRVRCVEGSARFAGYLRRNVAGFGDRVEVVEGFVGPVAGIGGFAEANGTGGFRRGEDAGAEVVDWLAPATLLAGLDGEVVVWKSDLDGLDVHLLVEHWAVVDAACDVIWFEFDPVGTLGEPDDVRRLAEQVGDSGRVVKVYDNLGRPMLRLGPGEPTTLGLLDLADWLARQRHGHVMTPYVDVWAVRPELAQMLETEHLMH